MNPTLIVFVVILILILVYLYSRGESFIVKNKRNLVLYHAPWCKYCVEFMPEWNKLKASLMNSPPVARMVNITEINCDEHENYCAKKGISSYPTITYEFRDKVVKFEGKRNPENIRKFLEENM